YLFFFQAEDGIRDSSVTGVQTCALPIFTAQKPPRHFHWLRLRRRSTRSKRFNTLRLTTRPEVPWRLLCCDMAFEIGGFRLVKGRSEERRVGKESGYREAMGVEKRNDTRM